MGKKLIVWVVVIVCIVAGIWYFFKDVADKKPSHQLPTVGVQTTTAQQKKWQEKVQATGTLSANQGVMVSTEVSGKVTQIFFKSGQMVQAGTPLVQLDPSVDRAALASALSQIPLDENQYKRALDLYKKGVGSKSDLDERQAALEQSRAEAAKAKATLDLKLLTAPFSGRLGLRKIDLGQYVNPGAAVVNLQAIDPMRVEFSIPQVYLEKLALGQKVTITSDSYPGQTFDGNVYALDSAVNTNTRSLGIWASIPNQQHELVPGTFAEVTLFVGQPMEVITVPQTAIVYNNTSDFVYKVINDKAVKTDVKLGQRVGKLVQVASGLKAGDVIVAAGQNRLYDGASVKIETAHPSVNGKNASSGTNQPSQQKASDKKQNDNNPAKTQQQSQN